MIDIEQITEVLTNIENEPNKSFSRVGMAQMAILEDAKKKAKKMEQAAMMNAKIQLANVLFRGHGTNNSSGNPIIKSGSICLDDIIDELNGNDNVCGSIKIEPDTPKNILLGTNENMLLETSVDEKSRSGFVIL